MITENVTGIYNYSGKIAGVISKGVGAESPDTNRDDFFLFFTCNPGAHGYPVSDKTTLEIYISRF
jgi:hypothetical protein